MDIVTGKEATFYVTYERALELANSLAQMAAEGKRREP